MRVRTMNFKTLVKNKLLCEQTPTNFLKLIEKGYIIFDKKDIKKILRTYDTTAVKELGYGKKQRFKKGHKKLTEIKGLIQKYFCRGIDIELFDEMACMRNCYIVKGAQYFSKTKTKTNLYIARIIISELTCTMKGGGRETTSFTIDPGHMLIFMHYKNGPTFEFNWKAGEKNTSFLDIPFTTTTKTGVPNHLNTVIMQAVHFTNLIENQHDVIDVHSDMEDMGVEEIDNWFCLDPTKKGRFCLKNKTDILDYIKKRIRRCIGFENNEYQVKFFDDFCFSRKTTHVVKNVMKFRNKYKKRYNRNTQFYNARIVTRGEYKKNIDDEKISLEKFDMIIFNIDHESSKEHDGAEISTEDGSNYIEIPFILKGFPKPPVNIPILHNYSCYLDTLLVALFLYPTVLDDYMLNAKLTTINNHKNRTIAMKIQSPLQEIVKLMRGQKEELKKVAKLRNKIRTILHDDVVNTEQNDLGEIFMILLAGFGVDNMIQKVGILKTSDLHTSNDQLLINNGFLSDNDNGHQSLKWVQIKAKSKQDKKHVTYNENTSAPVLILRTDFLKNLKNGVIIPSHHLNKIEDVRTDNNSILREGFSRFVKCKSIEIENAEFFAFNIQRDPEDDKNQQIRVIIEEYILGLKLTAVVAHKASANGTKFKNSGHFVCITRPLNGGSWLYYDNMLHPKAKFLPAVPKSFETKAFLLIYSKCSREELYHKKKSPIKKEDEKNIDGVFANDSDEYMDFDDDDDGECKLTITYKSMSRLDKKGYLNNEVINSYMMLLNKRANNKNSNYYFFNSFFRIALMGDNEFNQSYKFEDHPYTPINVQGFIGKKKTLFNFDKVFIPSNVRKNHWTLTVIDLNEHQIEYFDSLNGDIAENFSKRLQEYIQHHATLCKRKCKKKWKIVHQKQIPQQANKYDCGVFLCKYADYLSDNLDLRFDQSDISYFRRRIAFEIINRKID